MFLGKKNEFQLVVVSHPHCNQNLILLLFLSMEMPGETPALQRLYLENNMNTTSQLASNDTAVALQRIKRRFS